MKKELFTIRTKLSYYKVFHKKSISNRNEKTETLMNNPIYLRLSVLELSKILMYEFWYDYLNQNMVKKQNYIIWIQAVSLYT